MTHQDIATGRAAGIDAARDMLSRVSFDAASAYFRANSNADTLRAYGYWDGFLSHLADVKPCGPKYSTELTPEGEQTVIPVCERNQSPKAKQLDLFG